jgi:hypothetical protein
MADLFSAPITLEDMIAEARLELNYRRQVFGNAVRTGRMNKRQADRRYDVMEAILKRLEEQRDGQRATGEVDESQAQ